MRPKPLPRDFRRAAIGARFAAEYPEDADAIELLLGVREYFDKARAQHQQRQPDGYVYLLDTHAQPDTRYFKIGTSIQPHIRWQQLQSGSGAKMPPDWKGQPVRPLALRLGSMATELAIHRDLHPYRVGRTEWFVADLAVSQYIVDQNAWYNWQGEAPDKSIFEDND